MEQLLRTTAVKPWPPAGWRSSYFFQIQSSIQDGSKDKKVLVESEEGKSKENFNSPPEDVKNN